MGHSWQCLPARLAFAATLIPASGRSSVVQAVPSGTDVSSGLAFDTSLGIVVTSRVPCTIGFKNESNGVVYVEHEGGTRFYAVDFNVTDVLFTCTDIVRPYLASWKGIHNHGDGSNQDMSARVEMLADAIAERLRGNG